MVTRRTLLKLLPVSLLVPFFKPKSIEAWGPGTGQWGLDHLQWCADNTLDSHYQTLVIDKLIMSYAMRRHLIMICRQNLFFNRAATYIDGIEIVIVADASIPDGIIKAVTKAGDYLWRPQQRIVAFPYIRHITLPPIERATYEH